MENGEAGFYHPLSSIFHPRFLFIRVIRAIRGLKFLLVPKLLGPPKPLARRSSTKTACVQAAVWECKCLRISVWQAGGSGVAGTSALPNGVWERGPNLWKLAAPVTSNEDARPGFPSVDHFVSFSRWECPSRDCLRFSKIKARQGDALLDKPSGRNTDESSAGRVPRKRA